MCKFHSAQFIRWNSGIDTAKEGHMELEYDLFDEACTIYGKSKWDASYSWYRVKNIDGGDAVTSSTEVKYSPKAALRPYVIGVTLSSRSSH